MKSYREFYTRRIREDSVYIDKLHDRMENATDVEQARAISRQIERGEKMLERWWNALADCILLGIE
jgi:hypothetical protein